MPFGGERKRDRLAQHIGFAQLQHRLAAGTRQAGKPRLVPKRQGVSFPLRRRLGNGLDTVRRARRGDHQGIAARAKAAPPSGMLSASCPITKSKSQAC